MYEDLVERLRSVKDSWQTEEEDLMLEAADTIEYLSSYFKYYCPHYIQNVHDGDDKRLCAFWGCDVKSLPRWIPVTEWLPETPGEYIVAYHPCYWDRVSDGIEVGLDSFRGKTSWAKKKHQRVTHWMPLPKPPKEET